MENNTNSIFNKEEKSNQKKEINKEKKEKDI